MGALAVGFLRTPAARAAALAAAVFLLGCIVPLGGLAYARMDTSLFAEFGEHVLDGDIPYRDFALEYPPGALPAFVVPAFAGDFNGAFKTLQAAFGAAAAALAAVALAGLGARGGRLYGGAAVAGLLPYALGPVSLIRFDLWPTLLCVAGVTAFVYGRHRLGFAALGLGAAAKLFPALLAPLAFLHVRRERGARAAWIGAVFFTGAVVLVTLPFVVAGPGGVADSLRRQAGRALQVETLGAGVLFVLDQLGAYEVDTEFSSGSLNVVGVLPDALAGAQTGLLLAAIAAVIVLFRRSARSRAELVLASAAVLAVFVVLNKVLSPQFLLWLIPLVAVVGGAPLALLAGAVLLTHAL